MYNTLNVNSIVQQYKLLAKRIKHKIKGIERWELGGEIQIQNRKISNTNQEKHIVMPKGKKNKKHRRSKIKMRESIYNRSSWSTLDYMQIVNYWIVY